MLPHERDIQRSMSFLKDSKLTNKVVVSFALNSPDRSKKDLFRAVDQLAASLSSPLFTKVTTGFSNLNVMDDLFFFTYAPQIFVEKDLSFIDSQINPISVDKKLHGIYRQLLRPGGIFMASMFCSDPLGIKFLLLDKFKALSSSIGYNVNIEDGHFISRDGRHALMVIQTPVPMTEGVASKKLLTSLQEYLKTLPRYISADIICGHLHTVSNDRIIKRDIQVVSTIASVAFLLLFIVAYRDIRVILVFLIPLVSIILSISLSDLIVGKLSYLVIGLGTVIAGISIDYGIHVYVANKKGINTSQTVKLTRLLFIDALTTIAGFSALFFSQSQGYHQLAFFSILCIIVSLALALFILPHLLSGEKYSLINSPKITERFERFYWSKRLRVVLWALLTAAALFFSFNVKYDSDIAKLDGSGPEVFRAEKNFHEIWGGQENQSILVVTDKDYENAMEVNDRIYQEAIQAIGAEHVSSLAMLWPSEKTRRKNIDHWNHFWKEAREAKLKWLIKEQSGKYQFSENAFSPFFDNLYIKAADSREINGFLSRLQERFVLKKQERYQILSFFPDEKEYVDTLSSISGRYPGTFLVSRRVLSKAISDITFAEVKIMATIAILLNVILTWLFFKDFKETLIAFVPVITSVVWLFGVMSLFGIALNVISIIASVITTGLVIDYGIGMTYEYRYDLKIGTVIAVSLSALTTLIGTGVLFFAQHPALFSIGVAIVISILTGYLASVLVVPSLCSMLLTSKQRQQKI